MEADGAQLYTLNIHIFHSKNVTVHYEQDVCMCIILFADYLT